MVLVSSHSGPQNRFSNVHNVYPAGRIDGERTGRGRGGANEWHGRTDRGNSPPMSNGDAPGERVRRGDHYTAGGGTGGRYRRDNDDQRKVPPRLNKNNRHTRVIGGAGAGESAEKGDRTKRSQAPPVSDCVCVFLRTSRDRQDSNTLIMYCIMFLQRQQNKQQPKIEMGLTHFPPLPTSAESGSTPSQPPTLTTSHNHTSNEEGKTVADIVKGKRMKDVQTFVSFQSPSLASSNGGVSLQSPLLPAQTQTTSAIRNEKNTAKSSANQPGVVPSVNHQGPPPNTNTTSSTAALPSQQINVSTVSTPKVTANQPVMSKSTQTTQPSVGVANSGAMPTQTLVSAVVSSGQAVTSQTQPQQRQSQQQSSVKVCVCD